MRRHEDVLDFAAGTMKKAVRGGMEFGEQHTNVNLLSRNRTIEVAVIPESNNPPIEAALTEYMRRLTHSAHGTSSWSIKLSPAPPYRARAALVGWLRSAYLVAFAALGYRYVFRPALRVIREQVENPDDQHLDVFSVTVQDSSPDVRRLLLVEEPVWVRGIAVQMGRHLVFLPGIEDDSHIYENLLRDRSEGKVFHAQLRGKVVPWPRGPSHLFDFW